MALLYLCKPILYGVNSPSVASTILDTTSSIKIMGCQVHFCVVFPTVRGSPRIGVTGSDTALGFGIPRSGNRVQREVNGGRVLWT
jgi:hypothetical protein